MKSFQNGHEDINYRCMHLIVFTEEKIPSYYDWYKIQKLFQNVNDNHDSG